MVAKLGRMMTYVDGLLTTKLYLILYHVVLRNNVKNYNHYIFNTIVLMTTKFGRMVSYLT